MVKSIGSLEIKENIFPKAINLYFRGLEIEVVHRKNFLTIHTLIFDYGHQIDALPIHSTKNKNLF